MFKYLATRQPHPKMIFDNDFTYGMYLKYVYLYSQQIGNQFNHQLLEKYPEAWRGFNSQTTIKSCIEILMHHFDELYLMSDFVSLHYKGCNVGEAYYGVDKWRRIIPIQNLEEVHRVITKTIDKRKNK